MSHWSVLFLFLAPFSFLQVHSYTIYGDYPTVNVPTTWTLDFQHLIKFRDSTLFPILLNNQKFSEFPAMGFGFYGNSTQDFYSLGVYAIRVSSGSTYVPYVNPIVLWCANTDKPVRENATLQLTSTGGLLLKDEGGDFVWSTNTTGNSVVSMFINETGNLVLFNSENATVWQSFDHPTDTWFLGQNLVLGQRLTASVSVSNFTPGPYYLSVEEDNLYAFVDSNPPQMYCKVFYNILSEYDLRSLNLYFFNELGGDTISVHYKYYPDHFQFVRLESDGHLRAYTIEAEGDLIFLQDILIDHLRDCDYPTVCGSYGICLNGQCSCPVGIDGEPSYFKPLNVREPNIGCKEVTELSCESSQTKIDLLELDNVSYFEFVLAHANTDVETCKQKCLNNCSCKAAVFKHNGNVSFGNCSLPSHLFSLMKTYRDDGVGYTSTTFVKVQNSPAPGPSPQRKTIILASILGTLSVVILLIGRSIAVHWKSKKLEVIEYEAEEDGGGYSVDASEMPRRFTYKELTCATWNFQKRLGGGGFGSVYEGMLNDGAKVAVKRLDHDLGQGRKEFLAEVKTMGGIHHVNLVRLVGFCAEKSHRLLVYEYMCNGSLDRWIFLQNESSSTLDWQTRSKIILDIAKGLLYLHEDCRKRIAHLDIKPQNILLDINLKAKVSDFGLARLIERDQSHVITTMRGTRGYLAPEWLSNRKITEKVDVYSFGVVVLEIVCGRKNLDYSKLEEIDSLLQLVKIKAEEDQLIDIVDKHSNDMQRHTEAAVKMMRIAIWCLQGDYARRPSMAMVLKVLEGVAEMEHIPYSSFLTMTPLLPAKDVDGAYSAPLSASILSGPR